MRLQLYFPALALASASCLLAQQYTISTIAGNNTAGYSGDNGPATSAQLYEPGGIVVDSSGNIYIADSGNHCVRKISNGTITTYAGTCGTPGYSGDSGPATKAELDNPTGLAIDSSGNLYIADAANNIVRQVSSSGTITTIAGNASSGAGYSGDGSVATVAQLSDPVAVAVDSSGYVFIADANNNVIRREFGGGIVTVAGGAATLSQLNHPDSLVVDQNDNLFIADTVARRIVEYSPSGTVTVLAGNESFGFSGDGGPATQASLYDPMGVAMDSSGNIYIADTLNCRIRVISNGIINTIAGDGFPGYFGDGGPAAQAWLYFPRSVALDKAGNIYIGDSSNNVVRMLTPTAPPTANAVVNSASYTAQISPGSLATLFGTHLAASLTIASAPLPESLGGISITVNGRPAPILAVTSTQVNFQVPWETTPGTAQVTVSVNGTAANTLTVAALAAAPGIFSDASGRAIAQNSDYSLNTAGNPAKAGGTIIAYLTGSGPVNVNASDGAAASANPVAKAMSQTSALIGSLPADVNFVGLAPGFVGLTQMNIVVPAGLASGDYPLRVTIGGQTSNSGIVSISQ